ncbi:MAG: Rne/Rng family ribonuclease [Hyphomicrobiales bacterium]|nr:Rne/Rng family ribonuclease [Hyphomicrobiales bacterium]
MANKMLIDAAHPEETRVVVVRGQRVEEFDFESAQRKPLRGNIYLAKVMRVEPSLQAAFVDYGGNRHGFLAFSEIHPDYYQIPVADREALIAEEARSARESEDDEPGPRRVRGRRQTASAARTSRRDSISTSEVPPSEESQAEGAGGTEPEAQANPVMVEALSGAEASGEAASESQEAGEPRQGGENPEPHKAQEAHNAEAAAASDDTAVEGAPAEAPGEFASEPRAEVDEEAQDAGTSGESAHATIETDVDSSEAETAPIGSAESVEASETAEAVAEPVIEQLGAGDGLEEVPERRRPIRRNYKIQEVIKRRQILLVQVVKEERGNKGAALTTYLSLAGRYSVLMPNTARGGGISRKITNAPDRKRLKSVAQELDVPNGMGVIVRTAGAARTKVEIKRDFEYLLRLWENVRELTLKSSAPALVHEEGSLIKRAIRDLYNKDIDEILVAGEDGYKEAKDFMRMLAPSHAKAVKLDKETEPVFARFGVERQLDAMFSNIVTLRSGGYVVINQTEALVAIDVNSGRATREHNIEDTALKTNLEAAEEVARQLRLRDLAGLIVIDFIDMDEKRNNRSVEKRLKDCLKNDRARIQVGSISPFGLLEMSRQRIRSGVVEGSSTLCPHCAGAGRVRSTPSVALHVLRHAEDALVKNASRNLTVRTRTDIALYILNQKRRHLRQIEDRFGVSVNFVADDKHNGVDFFAIEWGEPVLPLVEGSSFEAQPRQVAAQPGQVAAPSGVDAEDRDEEVAEVETDAREEGEERPSAEGEGSQRRRRRRRRRRGGGEREAEGAQLHSAPSSSQHHQAQLADEGQSDAHASEMKESEGGFDRPANGAEPSRKRRRGRRGGRARRDDAEFVGSQESGSPGGSEAREHIRSGLPSAYEREASQLPSPELSREATGQPQSAELEPSQAPGQPRNGPDAGTETEAVQETAMERDASVAVNSAEEKPETAAQEDDQSSAAGSEDKPPEPLLTSTYDPTRAKRAGWWSRTRSAMGAKE